MKNTKELTTDELLIKKYFGRAFKYRIYTHYSEMSGEKISRHLILNKDNKMEINIFYDNWSYENAKRLISDKYIILTEEEYNNFEKAVIRERQINSILED